MGQNPNLSERSAMNISYGESSWDNHHCWPNVRPFYRKTVIDMVFFGKPILRYVRGILFGISVSAIIGILSS